MQAEWWLIKKAHEKGRLYQGLRTMHWDAATQTAVAKHELEYKSITDTSIYIKFPHAKKKNTYFIIWTTTPWTIPLNLAIMVNPKLTYCDVEIQESVNTKEKETWIIAKPLVHSLMNKTRQDKFKIKKEYLGSELDNEHYTHPLDTKPHLPKDLQKNPRLFNHPPQLNGAKEPALSNTWFPFTTQKAKPEKKKWPSLLDAVKWRDM